MVSGLLQLSYYDISGIDFPPIDFSLFLFPHPPYVISVESESGMLNAASTPAPQGCINLVTATVQLNSDIRLAI